MLKPACSGGKVGAGGGASTIGVHSVGGSHACRAKAIPIGLIGGLLEQPQALGGLNLQLQGPSPTMS